MKSMKENEIIDYTERFEQSHSHTIERLFWIACQIDNRDLKDLLSDMDDEDFKKAFPTIKQDKWFKSYRRDNDLLQLVIDDKKLGFIAEVLIPKCDNFSFKDGKPISWSSNAGISRIAYCYGDNMEALMQDIEKRGQEVFEGFVADFKKKPKKELKA